MGEIFIERDTLGNGSTWDIDFRPTGDQKSPLQRRRREPVHLDLAAQDRAVVGPFGRNGRSAGQFHWVHNLAVDSKGNIYTAEVDTGKRAQKFTPVD